MDLLRCFDLLIHYGDKIIIIGNVDLDIYSYIKLVGDVLNGLLYDDGEVWKQNERRPIRGD